jgi:ABC-type hemin transport system ATPase subunit
MINVKNCIKVIEQNKGKLNSLQSRQKSLQTIYDKLLVYQVSLEEAQAFIQDVARETQETLKFNIRDVVNLAIQQCFPNVTFDIDFKILNNRTAVKLLYKKNGYEIDPLEGSGLGLVELTAMALRIALWEIGHTDNVLIFDEPLKSLQPRELQREAFKIIREIADKLKVQFILVANSVGSENILEIADRIFEVELKNEKIDNEVYEVSKVTRKDNS